MRSNEQLISVLDMYYTAHKLGLIAYMDFFFYMWRVEAELYDRGVRGIKR